MLRRLTNELPKLPPRVIVVGSRKVLLNLKEHLVQAKNGTMEDEALREWLRRLQDHFVMTMTSLDEEARQIEEGSEDDEEGDGQELEVDASDAGVE